MLKLQHLSHTVLVSTLSRETFNTVKLLFFIIMMIFFLWMSVFSFLGWYSCKRFFDGFRQLRWDSFVVIRPFRCQKKTSTKFFHVSVLKCYKNNFSFFVCVVLKFVCFGINKYIFLQTYCFVFAPTQNLDFFSSHMCDGSELVAFVFGS